MPIPSLTVQIQGISVVSADNMNTWVQGGALAADMRTITGLPGMTILAVGMNTINDGEGGLFYWNGASTETDDNLNYIVPHGTFQGAWWRLDLETGSTAVVDWGSPGAIGSVTPNTGVFTTLFVNDFVAAQFLLSTADTTVEGRLSVTGTSTLTGDVTAGGFVSAASLYSSGNSTVAGNLGVTGLIIPNGGILGVTNGSNAAAGNVGEYLTATAANVTLPASGGTGTIVSLVLTPGDWDVQGVVAFGGTAVPTYLAMGIANALNAASGPPQETAIYATFFGSNLNNMNSPRCRYNVTANTTVYLNAGGIYPSGTFTGSGWISARRVR